MFSIRSKTPMPIRKTNVALFEIYSWSRGRNWRGQLRSLNSKGRAGVVDRFVSVCRINFVALVREKERKQGKEEKSHAHAFAEGSVVTGVKQFHRTHQRERKSPMMLEKPGIRLRARESRMVARILAALEKPSGCGTVPRNTVTTSVFERWQQLQAVFESTGEEEGLQSAQYEGAATDWAGVAGKRDEEENIQKIDNGVLLVVPARIYCRKIRVLIDSGATRSFISTRAVLPLGMKSTSEGTLLELGKGDHILSWGKVKDAPVVTAGLSVKLELTVTWLLHSVDVVPGMN